MKKYLNLEIKNKIKSFSYFADIFKISSLFVATKIRVKKFFKKVAKLQLYIMKIDAIWCQSCTLLNSGALQHMQLLMLVLSASPNNSLSRN